MSVSFPLVGIDPGRTTGLAVLATATEVLASHAITDERDIGRVLVRYHPSVIVIEDFVGSGPRTTHAIHTLKLIGFVRGLAYSMSIPVVERSPQARLAYVTLAMKLLPGGTIHERDALAHALGYVAHMGGA